MGSRAVEVSIAASSVRWRGRESKAHRQIIAAQEMVFVSAVSAWEMAITRAFGKLIAPDDLDVQIRALRFAELRLHLRHVRALATLPTLRRNTFDRMLIAQAVADGLVLVTSDKAIARIP